MGKLLKILLTLTAALALLIIVAAVVIPMFVDPNDFKPQIQSIVKKQTGRELTISGDLELSVFPWIGVATGEMTLSDAPGFDKPYFARIEESNIKVKLLPLLSKKIEISRIVLKGLDLYLAKNNKGITNWDDLIAAKAQEDKQPAQDKSATTPDKPENILAALAIGGISIENAHLVWDDQKSGKYTEIKDFNLHTDKLVFDQPVDINLSFAIVDKKTQVTQSVDFSTQLVINDKLELIKLSDLALTSLTSGKDIPNNSLKAVLTADVAIDLPQQTLDIANLKLKSGNLTVTADIKGVHIKDKPSFKGHVNIAEFNLAKLLNQMAIKLPDMSDASALSHVAANFDLSATDKSAALNNLVIKLDDSNIKGSVNIKDFSSKALQFVLNIDALDADRYLPAETKKSRSSSPKATPAAVAAAGASLFPVKTLRKQNIQGKLNIGQLKIKKLKMQGVHFNLTAKHGVIKTRQTISHLYQGSYSGATTINVKHKTPAIALSEKLSNIQIGPLMKDFNDTDRMTGLLTASANLNGRGNTADRIKSTLNGSLQFQFKNSVVKGFNIQKMIDNVKSLIKGAPLPTENKNDQTLFSDISGTAKVINGVVHNNDLKAVSSRVLVNGQGTANLATEQLNYKINARVIKRKTAEGPEKIKGVPLIIKITGTFKKPSYTLDIPAMLLEKNKAKIEKTTEKLFQKLDKKLGPGASELLKSFF